MTVRGARITGQQWTNSTVDVDLKPSGDGARFDIVLSGNIDANTRGDAGNAVVYTRGSHSFYGRKGVLFDGNQFVTFPADVNVSANNRTTGVSTGFSWIPLLGNIADNIAYSEAEPPPWRRERLHPQQDLRRGASPIRQRG